MRKLVFFSLFFALCVVGGTSLEAQTLPETASGILQTAGGGIEITLNPEYPDANQKVALRLKSNSIDLNRYTITWTVNGEVALSGIGKRDLTISTGNFGTQTTVSVSVQTSSAILEQSITISPQDLTVLWEAVDSYVPPFYKGKKLPSPESLIRVTAIPNFVKGGLQNIPSKEVVYIWKRNYQALPEAGGFGKDSILIKHNRIRETETISVEASDRGKQSTASKSINLPFFQPELIYYAKDSKTGQKEVLSSGRYFLDKTETILVAEPYFLSSLSKTLGDIGFSWKINNSPLAIDDESFQNEVLVKRPQEGGIAVFDVSIENTGDAYPLQGTSGRVEIAF